MERGEAVMPRCRPQRIIGSKQGYYKVSYNLPANSDDVGISKPPEWVPKNQVPQDLVLIWRNQRSERLAFIQEFRSKKSNGEHHVPKTVPSSDSPQINSTTPHEAPRAPLSKSTDNEHPILHTEAETSQTYNTTTDSFTENVHEQALQPSRSEDLQQQVVQHSGPIDAQPQATQHRVPEVVPHKELPKSSSVQQEIQPAQSPENKSEPNIISCSVNQGLPHTSITSELPSVPSESGSMDVEAHSEHFEASSQHPMTTPSNPNELRDENSVMQSPKRGGFQALRHAANAALGFFSVPTHATTEMAEPNEPLASSESNVHASNSPAKDVAHSEPLSQPAIVKEPIENVTEEDTTTFEGSYNREESGHEPNNDADKEQQFVSRSGRRIRRPTSTTTESSDEATQALNAKISQQAEEIKFLKTMYEDASNSATKTTEELGNARKQIRLLKDQLSTGIDIQRNFFMSEVVQWKQETERVKQQLLFLEQREHQLNDDIRRKAAEWDKHLEQELKDKEFREKRWKEWDQRKQREGLAFDSASEKPEQDSLSKELEELAAEANEVPNIGQDISDKGQPRTSRRRAAAAAAEAIAAETIHRDSAMSDSPLSPVTSSAESITPLEPARPQNKQVLDGAQTSLRQDHTVVTQDNLPHAVSPENRSQQVNGGALQSEVPAPLSVESENTSEPRLVATAPATPLRWNIASSTNSNPTVSSTGPRWKRRRQ